MDILKYIKLIWGNTKSRVGLIIVLFYIFMGFVGPYFVPNPLTAPINPLDAFKPPELTNFYYILGTGPIGESILGNIVWGAKYILIVTFLAALFSILIGVVVGITAGYAGGVVDTILMSINDIVMTMPSLVLLIILATMFRTSNPFVIAGILSVTGWTGLARAIRSQVLVLKSMPYIEMSKVLGLGSFHTIFREIVPNLASYIAIHFIFDIEGAVYAAVGLYFLGVLPVDPNNWGYLINQALALGSLYETKAIWYLLFPSLTVIFYMLGLILLSYGIDEITNPRLRVKT
ncbi:ABC transporter permease subunit [Acidianus sulfidivorans JP7]|uniref:ABC transporter permease n=1 Tax=Acidianus sulfidivorans JP7 TaxID=619593 RepID=A0A2U9ILI2_9CREN|nr:ABC transporter permease [Acidianus sulfidivorans]AWR96882.1 ABC transporter permease subunit [Acidianus sulfidivorans JP7]